MLCKMNHFFCACPDIINFDFPPDYLHLIEISRYFAQILKMTMQSQEIRSKYNLHSNEYHSGAVSFFFLKNDIFSSLVMR